MVNKCDECLDILIRGVGKGVHRVVDWFIEKDIDTSEFLEAVEREISNAREKSCIFQDEADRLRSNIGYIRKAIKEKDKERLKSEKDMFSADLAVIVRDVKERCKA
jgi:peptidoglycan hydrolase CwlO-like protein